MTRNRKQFFIDGLAERYREVIATARVAETEAASAADGIEDEARSKEDGKSAVEQARLAAGHRQRRERAVQELEKLFAFARRGVREFGSEDAIGLGALVDVSVEGDGGSEEHSLLLLPVGGGTELSGPAGDGFVSVATPASPIGRALLGTRVGDSFELVVHGREREWSVVDLS